MSAAASMATTVERAGALLAVSTAIHHESLLAATNALEDVRAHQRFAGEPDSETIAEALELLEDAAADWRAEVLDGPLS